MYYISQVLSKKKSEKENTSRDIALFSKHNKHAGSSYILLAFSFHHPHSFSSSSTFHPFLLLLLLLFALTILSSFFFCTLPRPLFTHPPSLSLFFYAFTTPVLLFFVRSRVLAQPPASVCVCMCVCVRAHKEPGKKIGHKQHRQTNHLLPAEVSCC